MASWNREQGATSRLLSNNFQDKKWKTAALKNAYALLGKHRHGLHYAPKLATYAEYCSRICRGFLLTGRLSQGCCQCDLKSTQGPTTRNSGYQSI
jgi:hypothetical protein